MPGKESLTVEKPQSTQKTFDPRVIRKDFPVLSETVYDKRLVYLDNAATTQKPTPVLEAINRFYSTENSNIHRGVFCLSEKATMSYENARHKIQTFINAKSTKEIIFVRGTTEAINLVAQSYGKPFIKAGDEILITEMEHHSNIVPWQMVSAETGATLRVLPMNEQGELRLDLLDEYLTEKTKFVSLVHVSNALGTVNDIKTVINKAHTFDIPVLVDGAQASAHLPIDVQALDADFYAFSGHKMLGPTGVGVLYGKEALLEKMPPFQGGGDMIKKVTFEKTTYNELPYKFEAGTPHIAGVIGLGAAVDYIKKIGVSNILAYETELLNYATREIQKVESLRIIGTAKKKASVISFVLGEAHAHDIGTILDREGIAIRAGHHCAMPAMERFRVPATARASFALYNTREEVDLLIKALNRVMEIFK